MSDIIGIGHLKQLEWSLEPVNMMLLLEKLCAKNNEVLKNFPDHLKRNDPEAEQIGSPKRIKSILKYLERHSTFPQPIILEKTDTCYRVLDGHHRIVAFLMATRSHNRFSQISDKQPAWIATKIKA